MLKRPQAHVTGDRAQTRVRQLFENVGYAVNQISPDYGEDLLVRVFQREHATPYAFLVQSKGSHSSRTKPTRKNGILGYPVRLSNKHLLLWRRLALPVVVTHWDATTGQVFWSFVPTERHTWPPRQAKQPRTSLHIPLANKLDAQGINRIRVEVAERHALIERQAICIDTLIDLLQAETPLEDITADPQNMLIQYKDPRERTHPHNFLFFGTHAMLQKLIAEHAGRSADADAYTKEFLLDAARNQRLRERQLDPMTDEEAISLMKRRIRKKKNSRKHQADQQKSPPMTRPSRQRALS